ncbi:MAG TPA: PBP1A family penicillin-binding protein [Anaeromyxobacteraceae bacterium]|nr:PBP1A family penicillin-binding protein [Anaeromyxobacteraceae bacterium]
MSPAAAARLPARARRFVHEHRRALGSALLLLVGLGGGGFVLGIMTGLPAFDSLKDYRPLISTRVYAVDGSEAFQFYRERRTVVPFEQIPDVVKKAVLASEDAHFYEHGGVNYLAIARCAVKGVFRGKVACGGSTITQQVVKTFLLQNEWRAKRKLKELVLAPRLEQNLKKDEILYLYLNQIYFGHRRYGIEEASRFYFGKPVQKLTVGEAAMLAGLVQSPERLSPVKHPAAAKERQKYVLRRMIEEGFIPAKLGEAEMAKPITVATRAEDPPGAWYADAVRRHLDEHYGAERVETDGLVVDVAMDIPMQKAAEEAIEAQLRAVDKRQGWRGALAHLDAPQLQSALPLWRERLEKTTPRPGEILVWDLGRVSPDDVEPGKDERDVRRMVSLKPLAPNALYRALVAEAGDRSATVDLGSARGTIAFADVAWARKYNPTSGTAPPRRMKDVVKPGDIVLVRVVGGKPGPAELARAGKPLTLSLEQVPRVQGALVAIDPDTRGVRALVGGYDYALSQFNRALQAKRQPGSAFKPFVWGAAVESRRYTPATVVYDTPDLYRDPWTGKEWKPQNFERDAYDGPMLLKDALAHSKNTVSAKLVDALGADAVVSFARRCGIDSDLPRTLSLALGVGEVTPLELVNAVTTIAARGFATQPALVLRVRDRKGQVLEEHPPVRPPQAYGAMVVPTAMVTGTPTPSPDPSSSSTSTSTSDLTASPTASSTSTSNAAPRAPENGVDPDVAFVLTSMMREVIESGTGQAAKALGRPLAGKTGTAQEHRDAWFVGFSPELVTGVWVGFDSHDPMGAHETGAGAALPAWNAFMREALARRAPGEFQAPPGVELARVDRRTGLLADASASDAPLLPFVAGTVPTRSAAEAPPGSAPQNFFMDDR